MFPETNKRMHALPPLPSSITPSRLYSILFFPSSALRYLAVLNPLSCLATNGPMTLFFRTLVMVSLYPSVAHGRGLSLGQLTCFCCQPSGVSLRLEGSGEHLHITSRY